MSIWRFTLEVEVPEGMKPHEVVAAMAEAALRLKCYVGGEVPYERIHPPLKALPGGTDGD